MSARKRLAPLVGVIVRLQDRCFGCAADTAKITTGRGGDVVDLRCTGCHVSRGHLSRTQLSFVADAVANGRPADPVAIGRDERSPFSFAKQNFR